MTYLCTTYAGCNSSGYGDFGYSQSNSTSYWGMYPGHNCTNYAAYRLVKEGIDASYLRGQGMAYQWGTVAADHGVPVDTNPQVGDIAWWASWASGVSADGHVAYVQEVGPDYIIISEDSFGGEFDWAKITKGGNYYPTAFIHFKGVNSGGPNGPGGGTSVATGTPGTYHALAPARVLDTRSGIGAPAAAVRARNTLRLKVAGAGGVPGGGISAVLLNVTVTEPQAGGYVSVYPDGIATPTVSNLNFEAGQTVPNLVVVPVSAAGDVNLFNGSYGGSVHLVADVSGYYVAGSPATPGALGTVRPTRLLDTRDGTGVAAPGPVRSNAVVKVKVTGVGGVPASGVSAVILNVTVTQPTSSGYLTVFPHSTPLPDVSNLNFTAGQTVPNLVLAPVGADGYVDLLNATNGGTAHLVADVSDYFLGGTPTSSGALATVAPTRMMDTRSSGRGPVATRGVAKLKVTGLAGIPTTGVSAVVLNVTVTDPKAGGYLTVYPDGINAPVASNLNFVTGQTVANLVVVPVSADGTVDFFNGSYGGSTQLVADVTGYSLS